MSAALGSEEYILGENKIRNRLIIPIINIVGVSFKELMSWWKDHKKKDLKRRKS